MTIRTLIANSCISLIVNTYQMNLISAGSISLHSTFKLCILVALLTALKNCKRLWPTEIKNSSIFWDKFFSEENGGGGYQRSGYDVGGAKENLIWNDRSVKSAVQEGVAQGRRNFKDTNP